MSSISNSLSSLFAPVNMEPASSPSSSSNTSSSSASTSNSSNTSSSNSSSGASGTAFLGTSQYAAELQSEVSREVQIAELPIQELTNQQTDLQDQYNEMTTIGGLVSNLQSAVAQIQTATDGSSYSASVTDSLGNASSAVSAELDDNAEQGVYSMTVNNLGAYASGFTSSNWAPPNSSASYNLVVGAQSYAIQSSDNSATGIASAINQQYGDMVTATVVNLSPTDTRIALQAISLGHQSLGLQTSGGANLFNQTVQGAQAEYTVTGGAPVFTNSRSVQISPGVTLNMQATTSSPINVTVTQSESALSNALSAFVTAYNAVANEVTTQHGQSAGPLQGNPILQTISNTLNQIGVYSASTGSVNSLYNLGLELNANSNMNGNLTFNPFTLAGADIRSPNDVNAFLGSSASSGFLQMATELLADLNDPTTGTLTSAGKNLQTEITSIGTTISNKQTQVSQLQTNLTNQMAQADALIAETEQQFTYMNEMLQAEQAQAQYYTGA